MQARKTDEQLGPIIGILERGLWVPTLETLLVRLGESIGRARQGNGLKDT
jgi:hypothetical protein